MLYDDATGKLVLMCAISPTLIGGFRQPQVAENGVDASVGTALPGRAIVVKIADFSSAVQRRCGAITRLGSTRVLDS